MRKINTDVDLDVAYREEIIRKLETVSGRIDRDNGTYDRHMTGVYFQNIPKDPVTNISTIDHKRAEELGYFKVDFLTINFYKDIKNDAHLEQLMEKEPNWDLFLDKDITDKLFQLQGHSSLLQFYVPKNVEDLAMLLAIIRPAKAYLKFKEWDRIRKEVWDATLNRDDYHYKRSHALAYAMAIIVNLNLITEDKKESVLENIKKTMSS